MLRYYSYYSVGGYKDLLLGDSNSHDEATYYLPMLPVLEERGKTDAESRQRAEELQKLPAIKQLTIDNSYDLPSSARYLFSHAGYKLLYRHLEGDKYAIALRDIYPTAKDETGRPIPFLIVIMGDSPADLRTLDTLAAYMANNIATTERAISGMIGMDYDKNGLRFDLHNFNEWIASVVNGNKSNTVATINGGTTIHAFRDKVALLVLPGGIPQETAITEQRLDANAITETVRIDDIVARDNPDQLANTVARLATMLRDERSRNKTLKRGLVLAAICGLLIGIMIASCCSH